MEDWKRIQRHLRVIIARLIKYLPEPYTGFTHPVWFPQKIAEEAVSKAQTQTFSTGSACNVYVSSLVFASTEMARYLEWDKIHSVLAMEICNTHKGIPQIQNVVDDIVSKATLLASNKWNFIQETDWSRPGYNLAKYYALLSIRKEFKKPKDIPKTDLISDEQQYPFDSIPGVAHEPIELAGAVKPDRLAAVIENWLYDKNSPKVATAWILYEVWGVPGEFCYIISCDKLGLPWNDSSWWEILLQTIFGFLGLSIFNSTMRNSDKFRKKWERKRKSINEKLGDFLIKKSNEYMD